MASPADLERISAKLDQAYAIMAYSKSAALFAVLGEIRSDDLPTRATRVQWTQIAQTMLRLRDGMHDPRGR
jgi:hypothetical protein